MPIQPDMKHYMANVSTMVEQPKPYLVNKDDKNSINNKKPADNKRVYNRPHVGVIDVPKISNSPVSDTLFLKEKECPYIRYNTIPKKENKLKFKDYASLGVAMTGTLYLANFIRKVIKKFRAR